MRNPNFRLIADQIDQYIQNDLPAKVSDVVMDSVDANFDSESYNEEAWLPLSAKYAARKGEGKRILSDTGDLRSGIDTEIGEGSVIISSDVSYAEFHNEGGSIDGRPPRRQFIPTEDHPDKILEEKIEDMIVQDLNNILSI